jgi:outer membrane lipoprotein-sorting protein
LIGVLLTIALAVSPVGAQAVTGDAQALSEVKAAMDRLASVRTYRARTQTTDAVTDEDDKPISLTMSTEVVNPDRRRAVVDTPEGTAESIIVGRQMAARFVRKPSADPNRSSGLGTILGLIADPLSAVTGLIAAAIMNVATRRLAGWQCRTIDEQAAAGTAGDGTNTDLHVARLPDASAGGVAARVYRLAWGQAANASEQRIYIATTDGLPRRAEFFDEGKISVITEYGDFNAAMVVELPRCN